MHATNQFIVDDKGRKTSIILSLDEWKMLEKKAHAFDEHQKIYNDLRTAFKEVEEIQSGKKKGKSLSQLIDELQN